MLNFEWIFLGIGLVIGIIELRQNTRSRYVQIYQEMQRRYDELNEDRKEFYAYYRQRDFDLNKMKKENPEDYEKIISWEHRFFWFNFSGWVEGKRKSVPHYMERDWLYGLKKAMKNPVHQQAWIYEIMQTDFLGYAEFNRLINEFTKG